jgi:hypothetical protein
VEHRFANSDLLLPIKELRELLQFIADTIDLLLPFTRDGQFMTRKKEDKGMGVCKSPITDAN